MNNNVNNGMNNVPTNNGMNNVPTNTGMDGNQINNNVNMNMNQMNNGNVMNNNVNVNNTKKNSFAKYEVICIGIAVFIYFFITILQLMGVLPIEGLASMVKIVFPILIIIFGTVAAVALSSSSNNKR